MSHAPTMADVLDRLRTVLGLEVIHLDRDRAEPLPPEPPTGGFPTLVGHLNLVQPNRIQVLGPTEITYWTGQAGRDSERLLDQLFRGDLFGIIVTDALEVPAEIHSRAREQGTPLLRSGVACERLISTLRHELGRDLAARVVLHGVFLDVLGIGTLLVGASNMGKSELALELLSRGHSLVADDAPEFSRPAPTVIEGECPPVLQDFLEVSGMGVLNVRAMYGDAAIRSQKRLHLIIRMEPLTPQLREDCDRLNGKFGSTEVLGIAVTSMTLPVAPGRNLAVMVEAAVRNYMLIRRGYRAGEDLMERQRAAIAGERACD